MSLTHGLRFAPGFEADYYITLNAYGDPTIVYASYAELYVDAQHPGAGYYLGEGRTKCETSGGALTDGWVARADCALHAGQQQCRRGHRRLRPGVSRGCADRV